MIFKINFYFSFHPLQSILVFKILQPVFGQKLLIQTVHHTFLESRHPKVTKNPYYVLSTCWSQVPIFVGFNSWTTSKLGKCLSCCTRLPCDNYFINSTKTNLTWLSSSIVLPLYFVFLLTIFSTQFSTRVYWSRSMTASDFCHMCTQSIKFYTLNCHILKSKDVWLRWFIKQTEDEQFVLSATFTAKFELAFVLTQEITFS